MKGVLLLTSSLLVYLSFILLKNHSTRRHVALFTYIFVLHGEVSKLTRINIDPISCDGGEIFCPKAK